MHGCIGVLLGGKFLHLPLSLSSFDVSWEKGDALAI